jgi:predicted PurR-regulated permease PerM
VKQTETDWFRPLWRRVAVTAFIVVWFAWEALYAQDQFWMLITGAALAYAIWNFFIKFDDRGKKPGAGGDDAKPED